MAATGPSQAALGRIFGELTSKYNLPSQLLKKNP